VHAKNANDAGPVGDVEIAVHRDIAAPRELVWRALSDPVHLVEFWGPHGFTTTSHAMDFRVGGTWRFTMHGPDGTNYPNLILYTLIEPVSRIEYDHGDGTPAPPHFRAVILLTEQGAGTHVVLRMIAPNREARDGFVKFGAVEGGVHTLERLEARVAFMAKTAS